MIDLRHISWEKFALCFSISLAVCVIVMGLVFRGIDFKVVVTEFPLLAMLCAGLSVALTLFDAFTAAVLTLLLIGEYAFFSLFSAHIAGEWELALFDNFVLQVRLKRIDLFFGAAMVIGVLSFVLCFLAVKALSRAGKKEPRSMQAVAYSGVLPRLSSRPDADVTISREEIECLLGTDEKMAVKSDAV